MGRMSRNKGASFEREIAALFTAAGMPSKRRLGQARDSGHDLDGAGPFIIECKRRAKIVVYDWLRQAQRAAEGSTKIAAVVMRQDNAEPLILMTLADLLRLKEQEGLWPTTP